MRRRFRSPKDEDEINLTPMLDVVFIMLIFFIVTASFVKEWGIDVTRPDGPPKPQSRSEAILISIGESDRIWVGDRPVDIRRVRANVETRLAENPLAPVVVQAHEASTNGMLVTVIDQVRLAGALAVSLAEGT